MLIILKWKTDRIASRDMTVTTWRRHQMNRLQAMQVFTRIVETNSFSRAAESLNLPHGSATNILKALEAHLNVRLLHRTTRRLSVTPEGAEYYQRCVRILAHVEEAESELTPTGRELKGKLHVQMPASVGQGIVIPKLASFHSEFPGIELKVRFGDRLGDLVHEGVDCAITLRTLEDSSFIARRLGSLRTVTAASDSYLRIHGTPDRLDDLKYHHAIHYFSGRTGRLHDLSLSDGVSMREYRLAGPISVNDANAYVKCGLEGLGIIQPPLFMVAQHLETGALREILPAHEPRAIPVAIVYPSHRHLSRKVRVFVEWTASIFASCPSLQRSRADDTDRTAIEHAAPVYST